MPKPYLDEEQDTEYMAPVNPAGAIRRLLERTDIPTPQYSPLELAEATARMGGTVPPQTFDITQPSQPPAKPAVGQWTGIKKTQSGRTLWQMVRPDGTVYWADEQGNEAVEPEKPFVPRYGRAIPGQLPPRPGEEADGGAGAAAAAAGVGEGKVNVGDILAAIQGGTFNIGMLAPLMTDLTTYGQNKGLIDALLDLNAEQQEMQQLAAARQMQQFQAVFGPALQNPFAFAALRALMGGEGGGGIFGGGMGGFAPFMGQLQGLGMQLPSAAGGQRAQQMLLAASEGAGGEEALALQSQLGQPQGMGWAKGLPTAGALQRLDPGAQQMLEALLGFQGMSPEIFGKQVAGITPGAANIGRVFPGAMASGRLR